MGTGTNGTSEASERNHHRRDVLKGLAAAGSALAVGSAALGTAAGHEDHATPRLHAHSKFLRDPSETPVALHGVTLAEFGRPGSPDPADQLALVDAAGATLVRVPIRPAVVAGTAPDPPDAGGVPTGDPLRSYLDRYVDPVVAACDERDIYCQVAYDRSAPADYTDPAVDEELRGVWKTIAPRYADRSHVHYELYAEPRAPRTDAAYDSSDARGVWTGWQQTAQPWVDVIRERAPARLIVIGGPNRSRDMYWGHSWYFDGENVAHGARAYDLSALAPLEEGYDAVAHEEPLIITGWGVDPRAGDGRRAGGLATDVAPVAAFLDANPHVSSTAWADHEVLTAVADRVQSSGETTGDGPVEDRHTFGEVTPMGPETPTPTSAEGPGDERLAAYADLLESFLGRGHERWAPTVDEEAYPGPVGDAESRPEDYDGDGHYMDLTGDGATSPHDVIEYFQHMDDPVMTEHVDAYDYTENGEIDMADVVEIYQNYGQRYPSW